MQQYADLEDISSHQAGNHVIEGKVGVIGIQVYSGCSNSHQDSDDIARG